MCKAIGDHVTYGFHSPLAKMGLCFAVDRMPWHRSKEQILSDMEAAADLRTWNIVDELWLILGSALARLLKAVAGAYHNKGQKAPTSNSIQVNCTPRKSMSIKPSRSYPMHESLRRTATHHLPILPRHITTKPFLLLPVTCLPFIVEWIKRHLHHLVDHGPLLTVLDSLYQLV